MRDWHTFVKVSQEHLSDITNSIDKDLPTRIQSFLSQVTSDYFADTCFGILDSDIINCQMVKRDIIWGLAKIPLPPGFNKIIHPTAIKAKPPRTYRPGPGGGEENKDNTKREYDTHAVYLPKGKNSHFYREFIQKHGMLPRDVQNPTFNDSHEECAKYIFMGECVGGGKCMQAN